MGEFKNIQPKKQIKTCVRRTEIPEPRCSLGLPNRLGLESEISLRLRTGNSKR